MGSIIDLAGDRSELNGEGQSSLLDKNALARVSKGSALIHVVSEYSKAHWTCAVPSPIIKAATIQCCLSFPRSSLSLEKLIAPDAPGPVGAYGTRTRKVRPRPAAQ